jgi:hypothetical protein
VGEGEEVATPDTTGYVQGALLPLDNGEQSKLESSFWEFHNANPKVYRLLVQFARQWRGRLGTDAVMGIGQLFERVRWEASVKNNDGLGFKLCNNHRAFYARLIMDRNPDLEGVFRLRRQRLQPVIGSPSESLSPGEHMAPVGASKTA